MNTRVAGAAVAVFALLAVAGCTTDPYSAVPDNFGEASRQTLAAQIIDPDPQYESLVPATSGEHAADAIDRFRNDRVKQPPKESTTSGSGGGGGASASGGS